MPTPISISGSASRLVTWQERFIDCCVTHCICSASVARSAWRSRAKPPHAAAPLVHPKEGLARRRVAVGAAAVATACATDLATSFAAAVAAGWQRRRRWVASAFTSTLASTLASALAARERGWRRHLGRGR